MTNRTEIRPLPATGPGSARGTARARRAARLLLAGLFVAALATSAVATRTPSAEAFGTVDSSVLDQKAVHEKITRVLGCTSTQAPEHCFDTMSMSALAGQSGTFGAVGEPDNPLDGFPNPAARHCDDGDHGYGSPHSPADAASALSECLSYYQQYMQFAVDSAGPLLGADGTIDAVQTRVTNAFGTANGCAFPDPVKGHTSNDSAKCNVVNGLGARCTSTRTSGPTRTGATSPIRVRASASRTPTVWRTSNNPPSSPFPARSRPRSPRRSSAAATTASRRAVAWVAPATPC